MAEHEVVITGLGAVTPLGRDVASLWEGLLAGRSGIAPVTAFDASAYPTRVAGEVRDYRPHPSLAPEVAARLDRSALFAADAALQALADSGLAIDSENARYAGLVLGSARPGETTVAEAQAAFAAEGPQAMKPGYIGRTLPNAAAAQAAAVLGVRGPALAVSGGGASGNVALTQAAALVRSGEVQVAFAGGADAPVAPPALAAFCAMGILSTRNDARTPRPFDADADGMLLAEGGAFAVLESAELAQARGARVYARLAGAASVTEPGVLVPSAQEAGEAFRQALRRPALLQGEIDYYCAYAAGQAALDRIENDAIVRIFGALTASKLTISAPKSMLGHMLGAAGIVDAIICAKAIETGAVPPTINLDRPAEGCELDYTPGQSRRLAVRHAMCYGFGFGGHHVALCFSAP
jgi:3-oxoacyl-[acyl-carrier-protein] synthase II